MDGVPPENPFGGLTESRQVRRRRDDQVRRLRWRAFRFALAAVVLAAVTAGIGGAAGEWAETRDPVSALRRGAGGLVGGLLGGAACFVLALWRLMKLLLASEALGTDDGVDVWATLFWWSVAGGVMGGFGGAVIGLAGAGGFRPGALWGAGVGAALGLVPAVLARRAMGRTSVIGGGRGR